METQTPDHDPLWPANWQRDLEGAELERRLATLARTRAMQHSEAVEPAVPVCRRLSVNDIYDEYRKSEQ